MSVYDEDNYIIEIIDEQILNTKIKNNLEKKIKKNTKIQNPSSGSSAVCVRRSWQADARETRSVQVKAFSSIIVNNQ